MLHYLAMMAVGAMLEHTTGLMIFSGTFTVISCSLCGLLIWVTLEKSLTDLASLPFVLLAQSYNDCQQRQETLWLWFLGGLSLTLQVVELLVFCISELSWGRST